MFEAYFYVAAPGRTKTLFHPSEFGMVSQCGLATQQKGEREPLAEIGTIF